MTVLYDRTSICSIIGSTNRKNHELIDTILGSDTDKEDKIPTYLSKVGILGYMVRRFTILYPVYYHLSNLPTYGSLKVKVDHASENFSFSAT